MRYHVAEIAKAAVLQQAVIEHYAAGHRYIEREFAWYLHHLVAPLKGCGRQAIGLRPEQIDSLLRMRISGE